MDEREIEVIVGRLYLMVLSLQAQLDAAKAAKPPVSPLALVPPSEPSA
jgi:hypothetical protein